jgi:cobalt/nickel transport protein
MKNILFILIFIVSVNAHFLTQLTNTDNVSNQTESNITIESSFIHPFEQTGMQMQKPIGIYVNNKNTPLKLKEIKKFDKSAWVSMYKIKKPGVYKFFTIPQAYFEENEGKFISHIPKTIVNAYGLEKGWDEPIGLKYEIIPMVKPFALYKGNLFQGKVLHNGKSVSNIIVEVELYNSFSLKAASNAHITQEVKTDSNGVFSFVLNHKGWWGFAALIEEGTKEFEGKEYPIENGALIWIKAY